MASPGPEIFSLGFRFDPKPLEIITYYLPHFIAGAPLHEAIRPFVHHAEVYACEPGELARVFRPLPKTGARFFFTYHKLQPQQRARAGKATKAMRAAGPGSWHSQGATDVLDHDKAKVGEVTKLRYKKGGKYTDWLMEEYSCDLQEAVSGDRQLVFCNVYVSPRADKDSVAHQESAAFFAPPAPVPVPMAAAPPKRPPAPEVAETPCPKGMRVAAAPSHPTVVQPPRPSVPHYGVAPPSSTPSVTRPSPPASAQPPGPVPTTRHAMKAPAPPRPLGQQPKKQQQMSPPTPPVVHVPGQAPLQHCQPQPSVQRKQKILVDPFEAMTDEAEEEGESLPALEDGADWDDLAKCIEDTVPTAEAEEELMSDHEMDQHIFSLLNKTIIVPKEEIP